MNRVAQAFRRAKDEGRTAIMPYVTAGDPAEPGLGSVLRALDGGGADVIEIGIPFSDPIADGPVIASAMHRALERGVTPADVLTQIKEVREDLGAALVAMVSVSIVTHLGAKQFVADAASAGIDGLIIPDADLDEFTELSTACGSAGLALIPLIAPTTSAKRQESIVRHATGFVYLLARAGVTGERSDAPQISDRIDSLRRDTDLPIGVGFGISTSGHVEAIGKDADGAIVGSALVRALHDAHASGADVAKAARDFVASLHPQAE